MTGLTGPIGLTGPQGPIGPSGLVGSAGLPGANGISGTNGNDGAPGATGAQGLIGDTGFSGRGVAVFVQTSQPTAADFTTQYGGIDGFGVNFIPGNNAIRPGDIWIQSCTP